MFEGSYAPFFLTLRALFSFINCLHNKWKLLNFVNLPKLLGWLFGIWWCKIYYCRLVRLGLWETFHNKLSGNIIPRRLVGTLSVITFPCSHKICRNTPHNQPSWTKSKLALWEHLLHVLIALPYDDNDYVGTHTWVTQTISLYYLSWRVNVRLGGKGRHSK